MNSITVFTHEMFGEIRVMDNEGSPWFVAKDIAERLGYAKSQNLLDVVDEEDKTSIISTLNGNSVCPQKVSIINESGLYQAIMRSTKPEAKQFKRWVTSEVLPAIRRNGSYSVQPTLPDFTNPAEAARAWAERYESEQKALELAQQQALQLEAVKPHVERSERFLTNGKDMNVGEFAKVYNKRGLGPNKLFTLLRENKVLMSGSRRNQPFQKHVEAGRFRLIEGVTKDGFAYSKTVITPVGFDWLVKFLDKLFEV